MVSPLLLLLALCVSVQCRDIVYSTVCPHLDTDCVSVATQPGEDGKTMDPWTLCPETRDGSIL